LLSEDPRAAGGRKQPNGSYGNRTDALFTYYLEPVLVHRRRLELPRKSAIFKKETKKLTCSVKDWSVEFPAGRPARRRHARGKPGDDGADGVAAEASETMRLSARAYHRVLRVARTLADLDGAEKITRLHLAEALSYRALADDLQRAA
jgi:Magnesium chelatase, subunit ChlI C-terminal